MLMLALGSSLDQLLRPQIILGAERDKVELALMKCEPNLKMQNWVRRASANISILTIFDRVNMLAGF